MAIFLLPFLFFNVDVAQAPEKSMPITKPETATLLAVGDIMLSRNVGTKIEQAQDPDLPFKKLGDLLRGADVTFGNLECPLSDLNIPIREGLVFRCLTRDFGGVIDSGFDVLSTANNHSMDQGVKGLEFTIDYLQSQNILPTGTFLLLSPPATEGGDEEGVIIEKNGIKFGFLAYSYTAFNDGGRSAHPLISTMDDLEKLRSDIVALKSQADLIIVSMHAGNEYTRKPNQMQIDFARAAIDAGADVVIGHHPHWIQEIEIYNGKPIFYSLGNFVFDQMWSQETREGLTVKLNIKNQKLESAELLPIIIDNYCCPRLATDEEKSAILKKINLNSAVLKF
ncbi:MAG: CapA family protein [Candidatus Doudnabacteria bacterium]|nr:CapA family protein [bacterium]MDZ4244041.1 CapA family protein [Candidatus Doudnabacteria bacterium]